MDYRRFGMRAENGKNRGGLLRPVVLFRLAGYLRPALVAGLVLGGLLGQAPSTAQGSNESLLIREVINHISSDYVAADHLNIPTLLEGSLARLSRAYPEVLYTLTRTGNGAEAKVWAGKVQISLRDTELTTLDRLYTLLGNLHGFLAANLSSNPGEDPISFHIAAGLLDGLDVHTTLMSPAVYQEFQVITSGRFGGVGLMVALRPDGLKILHVLGNSPGEKSNLRPGDRILAINNQPTRAMDIGEAQDLMRGEINTRVKLKVAQRGGRKRNVTLVRSNIFVPSVESHLLEEAPEKWVGYLRIRAFQETTLAEAQRHLEKLFPNKSGFQGLILDLRDNRGGVLDQAVRVADLFMDQGVIVKTVANHGRAE
ncbi:MAG: S41 family peptidase, partial [Deltaproteobacteria bacterium]|nr:S41 family peptidase [Deltaproteobacteria bacterium]